jgi:hypothetical protein
MQSKTLLTVCAALVVFMAILSGILDAEESLPPEPAEETSHDSVVLPANLNKASKGA